LALRKAVQKLIGKAKENYGYYKVGVREEHMQEKRTRAERNIKNLKFWNEEAGGRMQKQYEDLKKKGVY